MKHWGKNVRGRLSSYSWYPWLVFFSVTTGTFMVNVDSSILNVALPVLGKTFEAPPHMVQWVITGYLLVITSILPVIGRLSDLKGRKYFFVSGVGLFTIGSVLTAFSPTLLWMVLFRIVQGVGGGMIMGNVMSIVADTFPRGKRGRPLGIIGSIVAAGTIAGPALGGMLIAAWGWRSIFWINVPIGLISVAASSILLAPPIRKGEAAEEGDAARFDFIGGVVFFAAVTSLLLLISNGYQWGWMSGPGLLMLGIAAGGWVGFIWREWSTDNPLIDLSLFGNLRFTIGNITGFLSFILMMLPSILLPLFLDHVRHISISNIGLIMSVQAIAMIISSPLSGWVADRYGNAWPSIAGLSAAAAALGLMSRFGGGTSVMEVVLTLGLFGTGMGFFQSPNNVAVLESVPSSKTGLTGSLMATIRNFGRVTGVSLTVLLFQVGSAGHSSAAGYREGITFVFLIGLAIAVAAILLVTVGVGSAAGGRYQREVPDA